MSEKKYSLLTESDIKKGIDDGAFRTENIELVRDSEGRIVKHLPASEPEDSIFPPTLIQVNNTVIYQADIRPIIDAIIETKNIRLFEDLEEIYQVVIDNLTYYKDHEDRLENVNSKSLDASSVFEKRVNRYLEAININDISKVDIDKCIAMLDSYINVIFIYMISSYWLHKEKVSNDTVAKRKIENLKEKVKNIYEQLLTKSYLDNENKSIISIDDSLYAKLFLEEKNGIQEIEKLIKHDSRFRSLNDFMDFIKRCFLKKHESYYDYEQQYQVPVKYEISISLKDEGSIDNKLQFSRSLFYVLEKIEILNNIYSELVKAGEVDFSKIKTHQDQKANNSLHLTAIPLALHGGR